MIQVILFIAAVTAAGCLNRETTTPPSTTPSSKKEPSSMNNEHVRTVKKLIAALDALPELSKESAEATLGVKLVHSPDAQPEQRVFEADMPAPGPFARADYRETTGKVGPSFHSLSLHLRPGTALAYDAFQDIAPPSLPTNFDPEPPPRGVMNVLNAKPGRTIGLQFFVHDRTLRQITFEREMPRR